MIDVEKLKKIVDEQADDAMLWQIPKDKTLARLQWALRRLHAVIENDEFMEKMYKYE